MNRKIIGLVAVSVVAISLIGLYAFQHLPSTTTTTTTKTELYTTFTVNGPSESYAGTFSPALNMTVVNAPMAVSSYAFQSNTVASVCFNNWQGCRNFDISASGWTFQAGYTYNFTIGDLKFQLSKS